MRALIFGLLCMSGQVLAHPFDGMIDSAARRHGVDPIVLRAVVQQETRKRPWTFNCDGEGFYFDSKAQAVMALWQISKNPWMTKIRLSTGKTIRRFFATKNQASFFLDTYRATQARAAITLRTDSGKSVSSGQARIRQLWVVNTDIGIAQINYRYHGVDRATVQQWFDPGYNLDFAAQLIATHKRRGRTDLQAAGDYHSKTPSTRSKYMKTLMPIYRREKARAIPALAIQ